MEAIDLMLTRRSVKPDAMVEPGPDDSALETILRAATRVPDHGKLTPWRIHILDKAGQRRFGDFLGGLFQRLIPEANERQVDFERQKPQQAPLLLIVVTEFQPPKKIPEIEQTLSGGAVCYALLMASHALGFGAQWLTGWPAYRPEVVEYLGHDTDKDKVLGLIYIGSVGEPPEERPRPALDAVTVRHSGDGSGGGSSAQ